MMRKTILLWILMLLSASVPVLAQKVNVDWDGQADFSKYRTYQWAEGTPSKNPLNHQRILSAVENELAIRGYEKVDSNPDFHISYHAASSEDVNFQTTSYGYGYGPGWGWRYGRYGASTSTTRSYTVIKGSLVVDIWDASEEQLIWRGTATDSVSENPKPKTIEKKINNSAKKMFKKFPPKQK